MNSVDSAGRPGWTQMFPTSEKDMYWQRELESGDLLIVEAPDKQYDPPPYNFYFRLGLFKVKGIFMACEFYRYELEEAQEECERAYLASIQYLRDRFG